MPAPIHLDKVSKRFRSGFLIREIRALESVSFEVRAGEIFGFLGPNGAGKTTAIKVLMGFTRPTSGRALVLGASPDSAQAKDRIGFLPESPYFYEHLTAREVLSLAARLHGIPPAERRERVDRALRLVRLVEAQDSRLRRFSRGMLQRVGIAQALISDPELVLLDEPMGGLDPIGRKEFRDIILGLRDRGKTVFFSTHILQDVEMICDRVAILVRGRLVSVGRLDEILAAGLEAIEFTVTGLAPEAIRASGVPLLRLVVGEDQLLVAVAGEVEKEQLLRFIAERGGRLISLQPRSRTLEEFFMAQVDREMKAASPRPGTGSP